MNEMLFGLDKMQTGSFCKMLCEGNNFPTTGCYEKALRTKND